MPNVIPGRKAMFRAALAVAGLTLEQWAKSESVSAGHVSNVLAEKRTSDPLTEKIDAFIAKHMAGHEALAG